MSEPACALSGVGVAAGGWRLLDGINLSVPQGEFAAIVGHNGAGKTTLLRLINATLLPSDGVVTVLGVDTGSAEPAGRSALRRLVATVPQLTQSADAAPICVRDVVMMGRAGRAGLFRRFSPRDRAIASAWMERLGILHLRDRLYCELSGGEQRKTHLARALAQEPRLLLLDEPTSNLDPRWQKEIIRIVEGIWRDGPLTVLCVTHETPLPAAVGQVIALDHGRIAPDAPAPSVSGGVQ